LFVFFAKKHRRWERCFIRFSSLLGPFWTAILEVFLRSIFRERVSLGITLVCGLLWHHSENANSAKVNFSGERPKNR